MTTTAQQLWEQTDNYRRRGSCQMPLQMEYPRNNNSADQFVNYGWDHPHAAAVLRDHGTIWLIGEGYHRFEWEHDSDTDEIMLTCYDIEVKARTILGCFNAAIGAVLDANGGR